MWLLYQQQRHCHSYHCICCLCRHFDLIKVKWPLYRPGVAQRVGRGIALLFHDRGTRRGWVVSSKPWLHFTPGKDPVPIVQEAGWAPGSVWTAGKSCPHWGSTLDRPAHSSAAVLTELPGPHHFHLIHGFSTEWRAASKHWLLWLCFKFLRSLLTLLKTQRFTDMSMSSHLIQPKFHLWAFNFCSCQSIVVIRTLMPCRIIHVN